MNKRIIFISNSAIPLKEAGGGNSVIYRHLKRLKDSGHQIVVVYLDNSLSVNHHPSVEFEFIQIKKKYWHPPLRRKTPLLTNIRTYFISRNLIKKIDFDKRNDLLIGVLGEVSNLILLSIKKRFNIPFYVFYHDDSLFNRYAALNLLTGKHINRILENCNYILSVSDELTALLKKRGIVNAATLYPIPQGYNGPYRVYDSLKNNRPQLLVSGMIEPIHFNTLIHIGRAANAVDGKFYCVTDLDPQHCELLTADNYVSVRPRFKFIDELFHFIIQSIDILVVFYSFDLEHEPRMLTSFPSKFVEYCHLGLPVLIVAPNFSSLGTWAIKHNWLSYVNTDDIPSIVVCLQNLKTKEYWTRCSLQSLQFAQQNFNPDRIHQQFIEHLELSN